MKRLNYDTLRETGYTGYLLEKAPEKVLQFGEGNFLRAFVDYFIDVANEKVGFDAKVVLVQPIANGLTDFINEQEGLFTLYLRGRENGRKVNDKRIISCASRGLNPYSDFEGLLACAANPELRYIVSNTTEAGIVFDPACAFEDAPPASFPAKLTRLLYERYKKFGGEKGKGFVILSCELIDNNGAELERCVDEYIRLWKLEEGFANWVKEENLFCSTLVDRIVTGYPRGEAEEMNAQNGYEDKLLDTCEIFGLWVIEGPEWLEKELPFARAGLPVKVVRDHTPYKKQKVRILNGAHTSMVCMAYLAGFDIVRDCMEDATIHGFMNKAVYEEIIPTLPLPKNEMEAFAASVSERFQNPFIDHRLLDITLNSTSKWRARVLPSVKGYADAFGKLPVCLTFSFAAYIAFFTAGTRNGEAFPVKDDAFVLDFFAAHKDAAPAELVKLVCTNEAMWGEDLTALPGFAAAVEGYLLSIKEKGMAQAAKELL